MQRESRRPFNANPPIYAFGSAGYGGAEAVLTEGVRSGAFGVGWIGARALEGFEPLLAPMLVDSYKRQF
jgi:hypothetical protein